MRALLDRLIEPEAELEADAAAAVATLPPTVVTTGAFTDGALAVEARGGAIPHISQ